MPPSCETGASLVVDVPPVLPPVALVVCVPAALHDASALRTVVVIVVGAHRGDLSVVVLPDVGAVIADDVVAQEAWVQRDPGRDHPVAAHLVGVLRLEGQPWWRGLGAEARQPVPVGAVEHLVDEEEPDPLPGSGAERERLASRAHARGPALVTRVARALGDLVDEAPGVLSSSPS